MAELVSTKPGPAADARTDTRADSGGMAVVSFVSGLVGLLFANIVLGPLAIALAVTALSRRTDRRGRALLGLALGIADLVVFAVLAVHSASGHGGPTWNFSTF